LKSGRLIEVGLYYRYRMQKQLARESNTFCQDRASISGFIHHASMKSERSKRREEGSGVNLSLDAPLLIRRPLPNFANGFFTRAREVIYRHHQYEHMRTMRNKKRCEFNVKHNNVCAVTRREPTTN